MLSLGLINEYMKKISNWALEGESIVKDFHFRDFKQSMSFVNRIAELSERQEHHPGIVIDFNRVKISLTTHEEKGLTSKDFEVAQEIDKIA
ncbi:4a-hydroxytetrahydrobiopterin dehydratase [Candidatus Pacearchaeota archaeon]|nr:4a-hydroxytetrahydrobiopterin dehydratase [Candidatus Pacearchaeota archaeon]|tara:strand:+ start:1347 stop:1619 length:273 start_codon:yes stop_codon:yes gene_type:complete